LFKYIFLILVFITLSFSSGFSKKATVKPILVQDGIAKQWCPVCGMSIKMFYKTSYSAKLHNGTKRQYCSLRCLAVDMKEYGIDKNSIYVIDTITQKPIKAKDAFYIVKSRVSGTMSKVSKLAFSTKAEALKFKKRYRGKLVDFATALDMAKKSLQSDTLFLKKKKKKKIYPMGEKIFKYRCKQNIDLSDYLEINELKADIKFHKLCKHLKEKQLQAVALYLWEIKRVDQSDNIEDKVTVNKNEKCPVCGMFTYKYPRWAAQIFYKHNNHEHHLSFDGVKDLMKFYFNPLKWGKYDVTRQNISKILVTDYYSQKGIDGTKAYYVVGSDIYGPMGNELIPFANIEDAKVFKTDHRGTKIVQFKDIVESEVYKLD